jgi:hypothetical protein
MKWTTLVAALLCTTALTAADAAEPIKATMQSQALIEGAGPTLRAHLVNRSFSVVDFATETRQVHTLLLSQTIDRVLIGDELHREESRVDIGAQRLENGHLGPVLFNIEERGDDGHAQGPYYIVSRYGCCATGPAFIVYSLETGKLLMRHSQTAAGVRWLTMLVKADQMAERVVTAYTAMSAADDDELGGDPRRVMSVTYAQPGRALQRVFLRLPMDGDRDVALDWSPELAWVDSANPDGIDHVVLEAAGAPQDVATGVTLRIKLDGDLTLSVPLVKDRLDLRQAQLPPGFTLEAAPLP